MPSEVLRQVSFRFRREFDIRYLGKVPEIGDLVPHGSEIWVLMEVDKHELGTLVICELPNDVSDP